MTTHDISDEVRSNFHRFCDNFPFPVMLVHRDRTTLAVNRAAESAGYRTGVSCADLGHTAQTAPRVVAWFDAAGAVLDSYWIPLTDSEELFLHFAADITPWASASLLPNRCDEDAGCSRV